MYQGRDHRADLPESISRRAKGQDKKKKGKKKKSQSEMEISHDPLIIIYKNTFSIVRNFFFLKRWPKETRILVK